MEADLEDMDVKELTFGIEDKSPESSSQNINILSNAICNILFLFTLFSCITS